MHNVNTHTNVLFVQLFYIHFEAFAKETSEFR